jgi:hypothetical protein
MLRRFFGLSPYLTVNQCVFSRAMKLCLTLPSGEMWRILLIFLGRITFHQSSSKLFPSIRCHIPEDWSVNVCSFGAVWCVALSYSCELFIAADVKLRNVKFEHCILISVLNIKKLCQTLVKFRKICLCGKWFEFSEVSAIFVWNEIEGRERQRYGSTRPTAWWRNMRTSAAPCRILKWLWHPEQQHSADTSSHLMSSRYCYQRRNSLQRFGIGEFCFVVVFITNWWTASRAHVS